MQLIRCLPKYHALSACVATIGNFDGVHIGHQQMIQQVKKQALAMGLPACVIGFEPLPAEFFQQPKPPLRIYPLRDKVRQLRQQGIERFVCLRFDHAFSQLTAEQFVQLVLLQALQVQHLVVGDDFRFGHDRQGDYQLLTHLGAKTGMQVVSTNTVLHQDRRVSSTWLRALLSQGDLTTANLLLGQPYTLSGRVRHGDKLGRTLGFPTLNLRMLDNLALQAGVYAVKITGLAAHPYYGVANFGKRPTVQGIQQRFEVHVFGFDQEVYGQHIQVTPMHFIREQQKFASLAALQTQINQDCETAKYYFQSVIL